MKKIFFILFVSSALLYGCNTQSHSDSIEGAWKVVGFEHRSGDSLLYVLGDENTGNELKIWSKNHFIFVGRYKMDTAFIDNFGSGTYTLNGNHYEENLIDNADRSFAGKKIRLLFERKNDTIIQTWPADENWNINKSNYYVQKLVKAE